MTTMTTTQRALRTHLRRPIENWNRPWLGLTAILAGAALLVSVVVVSHLDIGRIRYTAEFLQAAQLSTGDRVTIAGIEVGTVNDITLAGTHVLATFSVDKNVRIGADSRAAIKLTTILGSRYLELTPAGDGVLQDRRIPQERTAVPYDLQRTLADATDSLGSIDAAQMTRSVEVMNTALQGLPEQLPEALGNLRSLTDVVATRRGQLSTLLTNVDTVVDLLVRQKAELGSLVLQGNQLLDEITTRRAAMQRLFDGVTTLVEHAHTILRDEPHLDELIENSHEFTRMLAEHDALLRSVLETAPVAVRNVANVTGSGNSVSLNVPAGPFVDSWMCALSGRARQFNLVEYFKDCQ
ncbi:MCE family protein [Arthrobacter sp. SLBN-53]|uniref:MCE family protein n=1 Tax=Arthrobacter sp. SLBN-53 TaxID=2768412 RepID=UPI00116F2359|nr:MCE family protein [Arthrobacter sp. SLBN-53]TQK32059.1 virulence factor Mce-like protein [Arthrobacter sp. SLBN-53]